MKLTWTTFECGENSIPYNHSIAETPFGRFLITWKAWKDMPSYDLDESPFKDLPKIYEFRLKDAQDECEKRYIKAIDATGVNHATEAKE